MEKSKSCLVFTYSLYFIALVALTLASLLIIKGEDVLWINSHHSAFLDKFLLIFTNLGAGYLFFPLLIGLLFVRFRYAVLAALVWGAHGIICAIIKRGLFSHLKRPKELLDNELLYFVPNVDVHSYFSFPSGHTATIFCLAFLSSLLLKKRMASIGFLLIALLVGYSRIYLLQHFLMDVAAGAAIGVGTTYLLWNYFEGTKLPEWMNRYVKINLSLRLAN